MARAKARTFKDLVVLQKAHIVVYGTTNLFPPVEQYGLTAQFRRAAVSIPANIAEGFGKRGNADKVRFMNIAQGSLEECRYDLILASDPGYLESEDPIHDLEGVSQLLEAYMKSIPTPDVGLLETLPCSSI